MQCCCCLICVAFVVVMIVGGPFVGAAVDLGKDVFKTVPYPYNWVILATVIVFFLCGCSVPSCISFCGKKKGKAKKKRRK